MPRLTRNSNASSETVRSKPALPKAGEFFVYGEPGDLALSVREGGLKTIFSSKRPISSGRKNPCNSEITSRSSVVNGRRVEEEVAADIVENRCNEAIGAAEGNRLSQICPVTKHRKSPLRHKLRPFRHKPAEGWLTLCNWCLRSASAMRHRNIIGPQVRRLRNQRGWSQEQLAAKLQIAGWDVSRNGLAKIETRIQWMRDYQLAYLLNVFRVDYADLYPASLDPRGRYLDDRLRKLMNTRF